MYRFLLPDPLNIPVPGRLGNPHHAALGTCAEADFAAKAHEPGLSVAKQARRPFEGGGSAGR
ncbi:hypothetical protein, partial [Desulfovibrio sp. TomC]|uniref:hypothetical protein n=1 Tax=Desulfovibrio sp. TomC TaxID=1562888 RepID=UPI0005BD3886